MKVIRYISVIYIRYIKEGWLNREIKYISCFPLAVKYNKCKRSTSLFSVVYNLNMTGDHLTSAPFSRQIQKYQSDFQFCANCSSHPPRVFQKLLDHKKNVEQYCTHLQWYSDQSCKFQMLWIDNQSGFQTVTNDKHNCNANSMQTIRSALKAVFHWVEFCTRSVIFPCLCTFVHSCEQNKEKFRSVIFMENRLNEVRCSFLKW